MNAALSFEMRVLSMVVTHSNGRLIRDEDVIGGVKWSREWWLEDPETFSNLM